MKRLVEGVRAFVYFLSRGFDTGRVRRDVYDVTTGRFADFGDAYAKEIG